MLVKTITTYLSEVKFELSKVTWPKSADVTKLTLIVILISGIVATYVGVLDFILTRALTALLTR